MAEGFEHLPGDGGGGHGPPGRRPDGTGRGRNGGWRGPLRGAPHHPPRPPSPRHRPGSRRSGSGGRGTRTLRGPGPHRAGRLRKPPDIVGNADIVGNEGIVGILFDLGVSSPQLDRPVRGFSYWADAAPLDMRMDSVQTLTAETVVNEYSESDLAALIARNGEERYARRIAAEIVAARPLRTTGELVEAVKRGIPAAPAGAVATRRAAPSRPSAWRSTASCRTSQPASTSRCTSSRPRAASGARVPLARGPHREGALRRLVAHRRSRGTCRPDCPAPPATRSPVCSRVERCVPPTRRSRRTRAPRAPACVRWSASARDHDRRTLSPRARRPRARRHGSPRAAPRRARRRARPQHRVRSRGRSRSDGSARCSRSSPCSRS